MSEPTADGVRQRNLARVLRLVHLDGPLSRATLTETTGLNRSTIADLVGELAQRGLVEERAPDPSRRVGRPSPVVSAAPDVVAIAVNPEVDAVTIAAVGLDRSIRLRARIDVDHLVTPAETAAIVAAQLAAWHSGGLAMPGSSASASRSRASSARPTASCATRRTCGGSTTPLRDLVADATGLPTVVGNDAMLGAIAEHLFGAARGVDDVVYLNGGASGIGGGLIIGGMPGARRRRLRRRVRPEPARASPRRPIAARATACSRTKSVARDCSPPSSCVTADEPTSPRRCARRAP